MKIYLAGNGGEKNRANINNDYAQKICILESFVYIKDWHIDMIKNHWDFLLDSGAFTFINQRKKSEINWDEFIERYANFINKYNIDKFFELDIDSIVGINEVLRLRKKLEKLTNKQCIPVWHKSRGLDCYEKLIKNYSYVAIGGIAINEIKRKEYPYFKVLLKKAKMENCKIHGLGFTSNKLLKKYKFYSVDSSAWIYGNISGFVYQFDNRTGLMNKIITNKNQKLKDPKKVAVHNFLQWVKFQKYARIKL